MAYYTGGIAFLLGVFLFYWALRHRKQVIAARERAEANGGPHEVDPSWRAMGTGMLPFFALYGGFASLLLIGGFFLTDLGDYLSVVDLVGLLVLIAAYSVWMVIRTHYPKLGLDMAG